MLRVSDPTRQAAPRRDQARIARAKPLDRLAGPVARYQVYCGFIATVFLLGGGARGDILSLVLLRPLAVLAAGYALLSQDDRVRLRPAPALWLLLGLMAWMAIQLAPLPYDLWSTLPGRAIVAANDRAAGLVEIWRSISLSPSRTRNSLFSLAVPLAVLLLVGATEPSRRHRLLWPVLAMAAISAVLGLLQVLGPNGGPLYLYRITNPGSPVGLFSNRNHHAIFLASLIPLVTFLTLRGDAPAQRRAAVIAACVGSLLFLVPMIIATGSRSGTLLLLVSLAASGVLWLMHYHPAASRRTGHKDRRKLYAAAALGVVAAGALLVTYLASRSLAFDRLFAEDFDGELRVRVLPHLWMMAKSHFPVGVGYGAFELAFKVIEPLDLLRTNYLNQAHNDLLQFVIEGGLPGLLLLAAFLIWFAAAGWRAWVRYRADRQAHRPAAELAPFAWTSLGLLLLGSAGDYPLRTPSLMAFAALLCVLIAAPGSGSKSD